MFTGTVLLSNCSVLFVLIFLNLSLWIYDYDVDYGLVLLFRSSLSEYGDNIHFICGALLAKACAMAKLRGVSYFTKGNLSLNNKNDV